MDRDRLLRIAVVVLLGVAVGSAGVNTLLSTAAMLPLLVGSSRLSDRYVGYVIVRGKLTTAERSGVGIVAGGTAIALSDPGISGFEGFGPFGLVFGSVSFVVGVVIFCYGVTVVFDVEPVWFERLRG